MTFLWPTQEEVEATIGYRLAPVKFGPRRRKLFSRMLKMRRKKLLAILARSPPLYASYTRWLLETSDLPHPSVTYWLPERWFNGDKLLREAMSLVHTRILQLAYGDKKLEKMCREQEELREMREAWAEKQRQEAEVVRERQRRARAELAAWEKFKARTTGE